MSWKCSNVDDFSADRCSSCQTNVMGLGSQKPAVNTKYFLRTNSMFPFCQADDKKKRSEIKSNLEYCSDEAKWNNNTLLGTLLSFISKFLIELKYW